MTKLISLFKRLDLVKLKCKHFHPWILQLYEPNKFCFYLSCFELSFSLFQLPLTYSDVSKKYTSFRTSAYSVYPEQVQEYRLGCQFCSPHFLHRIIIQNSWFNYAIFKHVYNALTVIINTSQNIIISCVLLHPNDFLLPPNSFAFYFPVFFLNQ